MKQDMTHNLKKKKKKELADNCLHFFLWANN